MTDPDVPDHVHHNVARIARHQQGARERAGHHQRAIERATAQLSRPATLYVLLGLALAWVAYNLLAPRGGLPVLDRAPFFWLQGTLSLFTAVISTMVLITQHRQNAEAEQRAHLDLQVNLLSEQKTAKIIALLEELRRDLPSVHDREDAVATAMQEHIDPAAVLQELEDGKSSR